MVWIAYVAMCAIWGTTWLVIKDGLHYLPPITGVGFRFILAAFFLYIVAAVRGELRPLHRLPWKLIFVLAALNFSVDYILIYAAETHLDSGLVAVLFGTMPFFVFGFGYAIAGERTTPRIWAGAAIALAGVALASLGGLHASPAYVAAVIGGAAVSALGSLYAKRESHPPLVTLPPAMLVAGSFVSAFGLSVERVNWTLALDPHSIAAIAYLGIFGSGVAFFCNFWALQRLPAWTVGMTTLVIPIVAVIVGVVLGGEAFTAREAYGAIAVAFGLAVATWPRSRQIVAMKVERVKCAA